MRPFFQIILLICFGLTAQGQKRTIKDADAGTLKALEIDMQNISRLTVNAISTDRFKASMNTEGEFASELVLNLLENGSTWLMSISFAPGFTPTDDKLGAHKVIAAELTLEIPEEKFLVVYGSCLSVDIDGVFEYADVLLDEGSIVALNFKGDGILATKNGNIEVQAKEDVAATVAGTPEAVINQLQNPSTYNLEVMTSNGSIKLLKAKN